MLERKVKNSINLLMRLIASQISGLPLIVNFSGGKDSLVCLLLALESSENVECLYMDSGMELPHTLPYVKKRCEEFGVILNISHPVRNPAPHRTIPKNVQLLPDYVRYYGYFPSSARRYCSIWLKQRPGREYLRKKFGRVRLFKIAGVRLDESKIRGWKYGSEAAIKKYGGREIRPDKEHCGSFIVFPLLDWEKQDVLDYLALKKVELHEGYKFFGMSGCKWCPICRVEEVQCVARALPGIYDDLIEVEREINKPAWVHKKIWLRDVVKEALNMKENPKVEMKS